MHSSHEKSPPHVLPWLFRQSQIRTKTPLPAGSSGQQDLPGRAYTTTFQSWTFQPFILSVVNFRTHFPLGQLLFSELTHSRCLQSVSAFSNTSTSFLGWTPEPVFRQPTFSHTKLRKKNLLLSPMFLSNPALATPSLSQLYSVWGLLCLCFQSLHLTQTFYVWCHFWTLFLVRNCSQELHGRAYSSFSSPVSQDSKSFPLLPS